MLIVCMSQLEYRWRAAGEKLEDNWGTAREKGIARKESGRPYFSQHPIISRLEILAALLSGSRCYVVSTTCSRSRKQAGRLDRLCNAAKTDIINYYSITYTGTHHS